MEELGELIKIIVRENRFAVLWRHLLLLGTRFPATIGRAILPLGWAVPVLTTYDTTAPVGEFLADQIIMTWRNRDKEGVQKGTSELPDKEQKQLLTRPDVVINTEKAKFGGREGKLGLWRDIPTRLFFHGSILNPKPTKLVLT